MKTVDLHLLKALFSLDPDNLQLRSFLNLGTLYSCSFFCPLDQLCKTLQTVQVDSPARHRWLLSSNSLEIEEVVNFLKMTY